MSESKIEPAFRKLWELLFTTPVHLDSALSKLPKNQKSILAQIVPAILLRPVSLAESLGVGVPPGEPWNLPPEKLAGWRPAILMAGRLHDLLTGKRPEGQAVAEDFPPWMIGEWTKGLRPNTVLELTATLSKEPPLGLRVTQKKDRNEILRELTSGSQLPVRAELSSCAPHGIVLGGYAPILKTEPALRGDFEIQDEGSQVLSLFALWPEQFMPLLQDYPGKTQPVSIDVKNLKRSPRTIVDVCAGAGGKSLAMADALDGKGRIYCYDVVETKLRALRKRTVRAGLNNIQTVLVEENQEHKTVDRFKSSADTVLIDAPCSGWGVLRRNPDAKWRQSEEILNRFPQIQSRLLSSYSKLVKNGGDLIFGVCTFRTSETRDVVKKFTEENPEFEPLGGGYFGPGPSDGFFMHAWRRKP